MLWISAITINKPWNNLLRMYTIAHEFTYLIYRLDALENIPKILYSWTFYFPIIQGVFESLSSISQEVLSISLNIPTHLFQSFLTIAMVRYLYFTKCTVSKKWLVHKFNNSNNLKVFQMIYKISVDKINKSNACLTFPTWNYMIKKSAIKNWKITHLTE